METDYQASFDEITARYRASVARREARYEAARVAHERRVEIAQVVNEFIQFFVCIGLIITTLTFYVNEFTQIVATQDTYILTSLGLVISQTCCWAYVVLFFRKYLP